MYTVVGFLPSYRYRYEIVISPVAQTSSCYRPRSYGHHSRREPDI
jgi:hypothetical protein